MSEIKMIRQIIEALWEEKYITLDEKQRLLARLNDKMNREQPVC